MENKAYDVLFEGSVMVIKVDPNKDGEHFMEIRINLAESADEVLSALGK